MLEAGKFKVNESDNLVSIKSSSPDLQMHFLLPHKPGRENKLSGISFSKGTNPTMRAPSSWPHLQIPSHWGLELSTNPPCTEFPREQYWSGLPFPSPGDLPDPRIEPRSPALQEDSLLSEPPAKLEQTISLAYSWATLAPLIRPNWGGARQILSSLTITSLPYPGTLKRLTIKTVL